MTEVVNPFANVPVLTDKDFLTKPTPEEPKVAVEEAKNEVEVTHEMLLEEMNKLADGRLEADIPLNDLYWDARNKAVKHNVTPKG